MKIPFCSIFTCLVLISSVLSVYSVTVYANKPATESVNASTEAPKSSPQLLLPKTADAGSLIKVEWDIEQSFEGLITLKYVDDLFFQQEIPAYFRKGAAYNLRLPSQKGQVKISLQKGKQVFAHKLITLTKTSVAIQADKQIIAGNILDVTWQAPKGLNGFINIQKANEATNYYAQPHINISNKKAGTMRVPATEGDYILRWYSRHDRQILTELPIKLTGSKIMIIAPDRAMSGKELPLSWQSPQGLDAFINIQPANKAANYKATPYVYINDDYSADLQLPSESGNYILRWYDRDSREVLAKHPITLTGAIISIQAPKDALIGTEIAIAWRAPNNLDAFINLQLADEEADYNATPYIYTSKKQQGKMQMPDQAGEYILRWYNRTDHEMLAETNITLLNKVVEK
jgi:uncharacterized protein YodC (DUF2158 family)